MIKFIGNKINGNELWEHDYCLFEYNKTKGIWFSYYHGNYLDKTYELAVELEVLRKEALNRIPKSITVDGMVAAGRLVTINEQDFDERLNELEGPQGVTITVTKKEVFNETKF